MKLGIIVNMGIIDANGESQDNWIELDMSPDASPITRDKIKDYSDVGLIYTPYSREFRVPASKTNNKAFKHWYNPKMYQGFDPRKKYEAMLRVNGFDWRKGYVKLNGVDLKKNQPSYYRIQFLGEMTSLRETLGNTELGDLVDLDNLAHAYDLATVKDGMEAGLSISGATATKDIDGDVKYPFISHSRGFEFDEQGFHRLLSDQEKTQVPAGLFEIGKKYKIHTVGTTSFTEIGAADNNIGTEFTATGTGDGTGLAEYIVTNPDKLSHTDLKPAVRVNRILDAVPINSHPLCLTGIGLGRVCLTTYSCGCTPKRGLFASNRTPIHPTHKILYGGVAWETIKVRFGSLVYHRVRSKGLLRGLEPCFSLVLVFRGTWTIRLP